MERVAIVGCIAAGKTTLARAMGERTGLPVVHLDLHFMKPDTGLIHRTRMDAIAGELAAGERWIIEGEYLAAMPQLFARADTVVFLRPSRVRCIARMFLRRWKRTRGAFRDDVPSAVVERLPTEWFKYFRKYPRRGGRETRAFLDRCGADIRIERLRRPREVARFLDATGGPGTRSGKCRARRAAPRSPDR